MADTATKNTPATPANAPATEAGSTSNRKDRSTPTRVGKVDGIPKTSKNGFWSTEIEMLRKDPGSTYQYGDVSQTTGSYLRKTYGLDAATRNNRGGRADLFVTYPGKDDGKGNMVPDEAEVARIKAEYTEK